MECPHCNYKYDYGDESEEGDFYRLTSHELTRGVDYESPDRSTIFGCPNCRKLFMDEIW